MQIGVPAGTLLANFAFLLCNAVLPNEALLSWGWRIPFLASILRVGVGMYIRLNTSETPAFSKVKESAAQVKVPLVEVLTKSWKQVLLGGVATMSTGTAFNLIVAFGLTYGTQTLGFSRNAMSRCQATLVSHECNELLHLVRERPRLARGQLHATNEEQP
ncbi:MFS transporter [Cupriavidus necator]|uniref:hypothetical protein n=1 Tax=Cupriavidus necator TaxID=106590 RepID=UPI0039C1F140